MVHTSDSHANGHSDHCGNNHSGSLINDYYDVLFIYRCCRCATALNLRHTHLSPLKILIAIIYNSTRNSRNESRDRDRRNFVSSRVVRRRLPNGARHGDQAPDGQRHRALLQRTEAAPPPQHQRGVVPKQTRHGRPVGVPDAPAPRRHGPVDDAHHVQHGRNGQARASGSQQLAPHVEVRTDRDEVGEGEHPEEEVGVGPGPMEVVVPAEEVPGAVATKERKFRCEVTRDTSLLLQKNFHLPHARGGRDGRLRQLIHRHRREDDGDELGQHRQNGDDHVGTTHQHFNSILGFAVRVNEGDGRQEAQGDHGPQDDGRGRLHVVEQAGRLGGELWSRRVQDGGSRRKTGQVRGRRTGVGLGRGRHTRDCRCHLRWRDAAFDAAMVANAGIRKAKTEEEDATSPRIRTR